MSSPGETDLGKMLATLTIERLVAPVSMVTVDEPVALCPGVLAVLTEAEGTTVVATVAYAEQQGWPSDFVAAWLTVQVHSSLDAVGLTAAISTALTAHNIPCNVIAGFYHDHLLVPLDRAGQAVDLLESLG